LFSVDKNRQAILLVSSDKSDDWRCWYDRNTQIADDRFDENQARLAKQVKPPAKQAKGAEEGQDQAVSIKEWEQKVLAAPRARPSAWPSSKTSCAWPRCGKAPACPNGS
jgi:hypothetical protein